ncbi:hypothetical protein ACX6XY_29750 [Streptomyces sp. O3]
MIPERPERPETDTEAARRLRALFEEAAYDVTPGPVPLADVERRGRARHRRRAASLTAGCALAAAAVGAALLPVLDRPPEHSAPATPPALTRTPTPAASASPPPSTPPPKPPTVVKPGERVTAAPGVKLWLTKEGKHWSDPTGFEQFRSIADGNIDPADPGISHQSTSDGEQTFHSGLYYGTKDAARVELTSGTGDRATAALVELPGKPGWGAWYVTTSVDEGFSGAPVTLYDTTGKRVAELRGMPRR